MSTAIASDHHSTSIEGFLWIPVETLHFLGSATLDVFTCLAGTQSPTLLFGRTIRLGDKEFQQIADHGYSNLLIRKGDLGSLSCALDFFSSRILEDETIPTGTKFCLLQIAAWHKIDHDFRRQYYSRFIDIAQQIGRQFAYLLREGNLLASDLFAQSLRIDCPAVHLTNVAAYCVLLAHKMGIHDLSELEKISVGAMLHDIGKLFLPQEVLHKTGRLNVQERETLERYPQLGYEALCDVTGLEFGQRMMVYQHQERFDGSGYPVAIENDEIHPWSRILAVADVFDSMTSVRPYRRGNSIADALLHLADNASKQFDPKVVLCWITIFQQQ